MRLARGCVYSTPAAPATGLGPGSLQGTRGRKKTGARLRAGAGITARGVCGERALGRPSRARCVEGRGQTRLEQDAPAVPLGRWALARRGRVRYFGAALQFAGGD